VISLILTTFLIFDPPFLVRKGFKDGARIDFIGLGLLSVGLGFLQVVLDKGQREDWFESHFIVACAAVSVVGLVAAFIWELTRKDPIVDIRLLKDRNFFLATLTMFVLGFVLYGSTALLPIFLQTLLGYTAMLSGLVLSPGGIVVIIMLPVVGQLLTRFQARWLVMIGAAIVALSLFHMSTFNLNIDFQTAMMARIYQSAGMAFLFVPINVMAFYFIPKVKFNNATGIINLARNIGGSFGIAYVVTVLARRSQFHQAMLVSHMTPLDAPYQAMMTGSARMLSLAGSNSADAAVQANGMAYGLLQRHAAMLGFVDDFWLMGLMFMGLIPLMLLMKKSRPHQAPQENA
jgi:DHA2 family multidrug resistance protein